MKLSELINKLQHIESRGGDLDLRFTVGDYYSVYGEEAEIRLSPKLDDYDGYFINKDAGFVTVRLSLNPSEGKHPKITFRK